MGGLTLQKDVDAKRTIVNVQKKRKIVSPASVIDDAGMYSLVISYQEWEVDGDGKVLGQVVTTVKTLEDAEITAEMKAAIDVVYAGSLTAI